LELEPGAAGFLPGARLPSTTRVRQTLRAIQLPLPAP